VKLSDAPGYPDVMKAALKEMHRQVGDLEVDRRGVAVQGMIIRHLVLPNGLAGTRDIMQFIASELSAGSYVNVMAQYHPAYKAHDHSPLSRHITREEYREALDTASAEGLHKGF
jgi:putative pyruvate formate lyase activating enzyme